MAVHLISLCCNQVKHCKCLPRCDSRGQGLPCHTEGWRVAGGDRAFSLHCCSFLACLFYALVEQSWLDGAQLGTW